MPKYISGQRLPWKRFWVPWDGVIACGRDGRGFLDNPEGQWGKYANGQVRPLDELVGKRVLILSGHPGAGKTVESEDLQQHLVKGCVAPNEVFFFHCRQIASSEMLRTETVGNPRWLRARAVGGDITLIIDGVDEGLRKLPEFVGALALLLQGEPADRLRVILFCRSAEWDVTAGNKLLEFWPQPERSGIWELCPLRYQDAREAARASGLNADAFMQAVFRNQVQGLAARPITLRMLLEEFQANGGFPDTRKELYARATRRMCAESDEDRLKTLQKHHQPFLEEHVHQTVCRLAALVMLTGKSVILKRDHEKPSPVEFRLRDAVGGHETVNNEIFEVTRPLVEDALKTAHFSFRGEHRYGFDHPTFAEFMTAAYLRDLPLVQLRQLLCQRFGEHEFIGPQLAEVAAWLALDHSDWRDFLIENDPTILLRTDISRFTNQEKERAVASLLKRADREEVFDGGDISNYYHALRHPRIAGQLRPYVLKTSHNFVVRQMAIEIAGDTSARELEQDLWKLIGTNDRDYNAITHALGDLAGPHSKKNLLRALQGKFSGDTRQDLLGVALRVLVPKMMPVRKVLPYLMPETDRSYFGSYESALRYHLTKHIRVTDVPALLVRMCDWKDCFDQLSRFHHLAERTFSVALENLNRPAVRKAIVNMWLRKWRDHAWLPARHGNEESKVATGLANDRHRRDFVTALLNNSDSTADDILHSDVPLVSREDMEWLLHKLPGTPRKQREKWARVTVGILWGKEREKCVTLLLKTYDLVPELRKLLPIPRKGNIHETLSRYERAEELRQTRRRHRWRRETPKPRRELLDEIFKGLKGGNSTAWIDLSERLRIRLQGDSESAKERPNSRYNIISSPGWRELSETEKSEATVAARRFLLDQKDLRHGTESWTNYSEAAYEAIGLLQDDIEADDVLRRAVVKKWIFTVTDRFNNGEEEHQELVSLVYRLSPGRVIERLLLEIETEDRRDGHALALRAYAQCWSRRFSRALCKFMLTANLRPPTEKGVAQFLIDKDPPTAIPLMRNLLRRRRHEASLTPAYNAIGGVALFNAPEHFWDELWPTISNSAPDKARRFFLENSFDLANRNTELMEKLDERQITELYLLLLRIFPFESRRRHRSGEARKINDRDEMHRLRDRCINILVERATEASLQELRRLIQFASPRQRILLRWRYSEALKSRLRKLWTAGAPSTAEILALHSSRSARKIGDEESLRESVLLSLERLQTELERDGFPSIRDLWSEDGRKSGAQPKPKREEELSHLIRRWLNRDLPTSTGIIVNCEVQVERFGRGRLDIKIEAISRNTLAPRKLTVIVEVKRCSHIALDHACRTQLVDGYLHDEGLTHGIYLVGWFGSEQGPSAKWKTRQEAEICVRGWADFASHDGLSAKGFLLDCRLPNKITPSKRRPVSGRACSSPGTHKNIIKKL